MNTRHWLILSVLIFLTACQTTRPEPKPSLADIDVVNEKKYWGKDIYQTQISRGNSSCLRQLP